MSSNWEEAKDTLEKFEEVMENIDEYLPETEHYFFDDETEWEPAE